MTTLIPKLLVIFLIAAFSAFKPGASYANPSNNTPVKWVIEKSSTLRVQGKSNINSFTCDIEGYNERDTIICNDYEVSKSIRLSGSLRLAVANFNCHSSLITRDFRKTVKADQYPRMMIRFLSLQCMPLLNNKSEVIKGWVEVELAGITKRFEISYTFSKAGTSIIKLEGGRNFCFSDFNLSPPRKLAGLIRIQDDFKACFQLMLRPLS